MLQRRNAPSATQQDCASAAHEKTVTRELRVVSDDSSDSDVGESPDAFIEELLRPTAFWTQRIRWYPDGCFGPYRAEHLGYSRRELMLDAAVHVVGLAVFSACSGALLHALCAYAPSDATKVSLLFYVCSVLMMISCSFVFNISAWSRRWIWSLQLADHLGIHAEIVGTGTALLVHCGKPRQLAAVWALAVASVGVKGLRVTRYDIIHFHIPLFLLQGLAVVHGICTSDALSTRALCQAVCGGLILAVGLAPWALSKYEFHNALWHVHVLAGSGVLFHVIFHELIPRPL
mmetsp:Transcript_26073/g.78257  ORF Transcript_26073/g.78257 Transcript_26073/m.78257 type:complete len:289 (-) Transcript_26073:37-903(-)|eukprot:CAMPEP_0119260538 /NCGR_PEP_ID=MMETSP1329-20130426/875_1 /TAXON_ID=114041 /ORGANISM="Genus nov. species nov., Strain RCC1024" /LENGTH=288 /DNA_ID=CAMNT_0007259963 /DNA_START=137 /DNA_END=1003 /DNA_ORIENTATION=+